MGFGTRDRIRFLGFPHSGFVSQNCLLHGLNHMLTLPFSRSLVKPTSLLVSLTPAVSRTHSTLQLASSHRLISNRLNCCSLVSINMGDLPHLLCTWKCLSVVNVVPNERSGVVSATHTRAANVSVLCR